ncbi:hypothetical protein IW261DRAFT_1416749 [Armillaria novae-zelandiae]|uniref:Uncharacterized protein n=1 Tax=Armillaria novae-zelandiae TaxID=153914 RepID=A0AA39UJ41_9AGAR|nr:hypothetical protein IW261DRAFT_1416749 [Armillaria novae-zelandiae]
MKSVNHAFRTRVDNNRNIEPILTCKIARQALCLLHTYGENWDESGYMWKTIERHSENIIGGVNDDFEVPEQSVASTGNFLNLLQRSNAPNLKDSPPLSSCCVRSVVATRPYWLEDIMFEGEHGREEKKKGRDRVHHFRGNFTTRVPAIDLLQKGTKCSSNNTYLNKIMPFSHGYWAFKDPNKIQMSPFYDGRLESSTRWENVGIGGLDMNNFQNYRLKYLPSDVTKFERGKGLFGWENESAPQMPTSPMQEFPSRVDEVDVNRRTSAEKQDWTKMHQFPYEYTRIDGIGRLHILSTRREEEGETFADEFLLDEARNLPELGSFW